MKAVRINFLLYLLPFCWLQPASLGAQELRCDAVRPLPGSRSGYQKRGDRCEGLYVADVGARSIDVSSFTSGNLTYDVGLKLPLRVFVSSHAPSVNVRAVAIPPRTYYRMDAVLHPGAVLVWPVTDVLLPEGLTDSRIGIFGWTGTENAKTFVPVRVVADRSGKVPLGSNPILLTIQVSFDAESIKWRWARAQRDECAAFERWQDATTQPRVTASSPIKINLKQVPGRFACVEIAARSQFGLDWVTLKIRVEMPDR